MRVTRGGREEGMWSDEGAAASYSNVWCQLETEVHM